MENYLTKAEKAKQTVEELLSLKSENQVDDYIKNHSKDINTEVRDVLQNKGLGNKTFADELIDFVQEPSSVEQLWDKMYEKVDVHVINRGYLKEKTDDKKRIIEFNLSEKELKEGILTSIELKDVGSLNFYLSEGGQIDKEAIGLYKEMKLNGVDFSLSDEEKEMGQSLSYQKLFEDNIPENLKTELENISDMEKSNLKEVREEIVEAIRNNDKVLLEDLKYFDKDSANPVLKSDLELISSLKKEGVDYSLTEEEIGKGKTNPLDVMMKASYNKNNEISLDVNMEGNVEIKSNNPDVIKDLVKDLSSEEMVSVVAGEKNDKLLILNNVMDDKDRGAQIHIISSLNKNFIRLKDTPLNEVAKKLDKEMLENESESDKVRVPLFTAEKDGKTEAVYHNFFSIPPVKEAIEQATETVRKGYEDLLKELEDKNAKGENAPSVEVDGVKITRYEVDIDRSVVERPKEQVELENDRLKKENEMLKDERFTPEDIAVINNEALLTENTSLKDENRRLASELETRISEQETIAEYLTSMGKSPAFDNQEIKQIMAEMAEKDAAAPFKEGDYVKIDRNITVLQKDGNTREKDISLHGIVMGKQDDKYVVHYQDSLNPDKETKKFYGRGTRVVEEKGLTKMNVPEQLKDEVNKVRDNVKSSIVYTLIQTDNFTKAMETKTERLEKVNGELVKENTELSAQNKKYMETIAKMNQQIGTLNKQLDEYRSEVKDLRTDFQKIGKAFIKTQDNNFELNARLDQLASVVENRQERITPREIVGKAIEGQDRNGNKTLNVMVTKEDLEKLSLDNRGNYKVAMTKLDRPGVDGATHYIHNRSGKDSRSEINITIRKDDFEKLESKTNVYSEKTEVAFTISELDQKVKLEKGLTIDYAMYQKGEGEEGKTQFFGMAKDAEKERQAESTNQLEGNSKDSQEKNKEKTRSISKSREEENER